MTQIIDAVYENGVFRPLAPPQGLAEHAAVRLSVENAGSPHPLLPVCGTLPDEDAREIEKIIEQEFEKVNPDDWK